MYPKITFLLAFISCFYTSLCFVSFKIPFFSVQPAKTCNLRNIISTKYRILNALTRLSAISDLYEGEVYDDDDSSVLEDDIDDGDQDIDLLDDDDDIDSDPDEELDIGAESFKDIVQEDSSKDDIETDEDFDYTNIRAARDRKMRSTDALRSENPTRDYVKVPDPYKKYYVALGYVNNAEQEEKRRSYWIHHMQWVRRSTLLPNAMSKVHFDYTLLSQDCTQPIGQLIGLRANNTIDIYDILDSEPLQAVGAIDKWNIYEIKYETHENLTHPSQNMQLFIGFDTTNKRSSKDKEKSKRIQLAKESIKYHQNKYERVVKYGHLYPIKDTIPIGIEDSRTNSINWKSNEEWSIAHDSDNTEAPIGTLILINSKTNTDMKRYMSSDPLVAQSIYSKTVNLHVIYIYFVKEYGYNYEVSNVIR